MSVSVMFILTWYKRLFLLLFRKIKNSIIGNKMKKSSFMLLGVIPRSASTNKIHLHICKISPSTDSTWYIYRMAQVLRHRFHTFGLCNILCVYS